MKLKILIITLVFVLTACAAKPTPQVSPEPSATQALPTQPAAYPPVLAPEPAYNPYPQTGEEVVPMPTPGANSENPFAPVFEDKNLVRGNVFLDESDITTVEGNPPKFMLNLIGNLPTPCHLLRAQVGQPDDQNQINVLVYSVTDPNTMCTQVLKPFGESVPLGDFPAGTYTVLVNGQEVGKITVP